MGQVVVQCRFMAMIDRFWSGLRATNAAIETPDVVGPGDDGGPVDAVVAVERRLDLAQLDPVAALLDHPVAAAVELVAARSVVDDQVAGAVPAAAVRRRGRRRGRSARAGRSSRASRRGRR